jgi:hypothetical protein
MHVNAYEPVGVPISFSRRPYQNTPVWCTIGQPSVEYAVRRGEEKGRRLLPGARERRGVGLRGVKIREIHVPPTR